MYAKSLARNNQARFVYLDLIKDWNDAQTEGKLLARLINW